jgi:hypothetical protein
VPPAYRDFYYPLNVFMHILTAEEGDVRYLHYGFFESPDDSIGVAQERSTALLLSRLPSPPARLLEVGIGLGTTMARLASLGYDVEGITPDAQQIAVAAARHPSLRVHCAPFESFDGGAYDAVFFQESSQYIPADALFARAAALTSRVIVLDEFALQPVEGTYLHQLSGFLAAASAHGFAPIEELDLSAQAAPSTEYFNVRFERHRAALIEDLGITSEQVDVLIESGVRYRERYASGVYGYRLLVLSASARTRSSGT